MLVIDGDKNNINISADRYYFYILILQNCREIQCIKF